MPFPDGMEHNHEGEPRHIGIEIEFAAVSAEEATGIVQKLFGGEIYQIDPHLFEVRGTDFGDFRCELDLQYAHGTNEGEDAVVGEQHFADFAVELRQIIGDVSAVVVPCEIVCPPVEFAALGRIDGLREALRRRGAQGTGESPFYAFGAQFNPEIASREAAYITAMLKAYMLLSDWLRAQIQVDPARWLLTFADPFPPAYMELVLAEDYWPGLEDLIDNHLAYNATRNRDLDMLPLFSWFDQARVRAAINDPRIKQRPTFHYRLPNAHLQDPDWTLAVEWNRWCQVEHLAAGREWLASAAREWRENRAGLMGRSGKELARRWIV